MKKVFLVFFVLIAAFIFAENWIFEMQTIELPTGNGKNEIYVFDAPDNLIDVPDEGPIVFQIDEKGSIYILDRYQIKKFAEIGEFVCSTRAADIQIVSFVVQQNQIWTICGDHQNNVYLRRFDDNCQLIDTHQIENRKNSLAVNQNGKVGLNLGNNNFLEFNFHGNELSTTDGVLMNNCLLDFNVREGRQKVLIPEENIALDLNEIWPNDIGYTLFGFDQIGNLYFNIYSEPRQDSSLGIISGSGEVIETNVVFPHYTKFGLDFARGISNVVTLNGAIYQMIPMPDKIEIRQWTRVE
ncbi:MAG: hypothetical protein Q7J16_07295 [Candidatus Cloacimonadales bacterium]|nr:hypothetical protein [Candidatus Cloacimonadales bacterium]